MKRFATTLAVAISSLLLPRLAAAQEPPREPARDGGWGAATTVTAVAALGSVLFMPRVFYADPPITAGWKSRWHASAMAPTMTILSLALANEVAFKDVLRSPRPGCEEANQGAGNCRDFGLMSAPAFVASSALGQGAAVFVIDTLKWSNGELNVPSLLGHVGVPLVLAAITGGGRIGGNWESGEQVGMSSLVGLGVGALTGVVYSYLARPECPFGSGVVCW